MHTVSIKLAASQAALRLSRADRSQADIQALRHYKYCHNWRLLLLHGHCRGRSPFKKLATAC